MSSSHSLPCPRVRKSISSASKLNGLRVKKGAGGPARESHPYTRRELDRVCLAAVLDALFPKSIAADVARLTKGCGWGRELSQVEGRG